MSPVKKKAASPQAASPSAKEDSEKTASKKTASKKAQGKKAKASLPLPTIEFEIEAGYPARIVVGVDEVGRGCLAGPVVAGAVLLPDAWAEEGATDPRLKALKRVHAPLRSITDSKLVPAEDRPELAAWIRENVRAYGIGWASVEEIDQVNIYQASFLAMRRAIEQLEAKLGGPGSPAGTVQHVLVDGNQRHPDYPGRSSALIKGDQRCLSISCAAILAKVYRDEWMQKLAIEVPGYGLETHKGYATPSHYRLVLEKGPSALHRRSFSPMKEMLGNQTPVPQTEFTFTEGPLEEAAEAEE